MSRIVNIIACLTVLTTALPQGWCCYVPLGSGICRTAGGHGIDGNRLTAEGGSCPLCRPLSAAPDTHEIGSHSSAPEAPLNAPLSECCRRAPMSRPTGTDIFDNLLVAFAVSNQQIVEIGQPDFLLGSAQADEPLHSSLRLHASLGRWRC